jgi:hypothetical protein
VATWAALQIGQGAPPPEARSANHGLSLWFSQTQRQLSQREHACITGRPPGPGDSVCQNMPLAGSSPVTMFRLSGTGHKETHFTERW